MINLQNVSKSYGDNILFQDLTFQILPNEITGIMGRSGSGKSTLLNIIGLLESDYSGDIEWFGQKKIKVGSSKAQKILRHHISYLFQNFALLENESVYYNLKLATKYSLGKNISKSIEDALNKVGLYNMQSRIIHTLSGGEQQRVALARCLLKPCSVILCDEPTGNLDELTKEEIKQLFLNIKKEKALVIVTHDPSLRDIFDKLIFL